MLVYRNPNDISDVDTIMWSRNTVQVLCANGLAARHSTHQQRRSEPNAKRPQIPHGGFLIEDPPSLHLRNDCHNARAGPRAFGRIVGRIMNIAAWHVAVILLALTVAANADIPDQYQGKPFQDAANVHATGPQVIPGRLQAAFYDLGGEGIAYHDTDTVNHGSGKLNYTPGHCEEDVPLTICHFRPNRGRGYFVREKDGRSEPSQSGCSRLAAAIHWVDRGWRMDQLHCGGKERWQIQDRSDVVQFELNKQPAADCQLPVDVPEQLPLPNFPDWIVWHTWNKAECGEINFPREGRQLLTLHYKKGNNLAYFDFIPAD